MMNLKSNKTEDIKYDLLNRCMDGERLSADENRLLKRYCIEDSDLSEMLESYSITRESLRSGVKDDINPPYPDFFNHKLMNELDNSASKTIAGNFYYSKFFSFFQSIFSKPLFKLVFAIFLILFTCLGYYRYNLLNVHSNLSEVMELYTPDSGVSASTYYDVKTQATVISLNGLPSISD